MLATMTGSLLTLVCDDEASQIRLEDLPAGPAGEACLTPLDGVELLFDNADGRLVRILVDATASGGQLVTGELVLFFIAGLLGYQAAAAVEEARRWAGAPIPLRVDEEKLASLSRLARLDAARATSPVAGSPGWAVEAARLAAMAGLTARAAAEARRATTALDGAPPDAVPAELIDAIADGVQEIDPGLAERLREHVVRPQPGPDTAAGDTTARGTMAQPDWAWSAVPSVPAGDGDRREEPECWLDPQTVPPGVFRHHLWPEADLTVRSVGSGLWVEAEIVSGADLTALARCRVRLVDPARRKVIAMAPFRHTGGSQVVAEIPHGGPFGGAWVEMTEGPGRPVFSAQLRHMRRAMRWADAALCAGRRPPGPADAEWDRLAGQAWTRCAEDWLAARDYDRAYLAAGRAAGLGVDIAVARPPSDWAKDLAGRFALQEAPFLAETIGLTTIKNVTVPR
jgi:hypothetical protein